VLRASKTRKIKQYRKSAQSVAVELKEEWQTDLPLGEESKPKQEGNNSQTTLNGVFADSAFADNKQRPIHRWIPWIAGFSSEFVRDAFSRYLSGPSCSRVLVLDPFCGVGTTIIEALRCGYDAVGFEINPYAALAARTKCESAAISPTRLQQYLGKFQEAMADSSKDRAAALVPEHFRSRIPFFGRQAEAKVLKALGFINALPPSPIRDLFSVAFGAVMVSLSNYSYEPSLSSRPAAGKAIQEDAPVVEAILAKLLAMKTDISWFRGELDRLARQPSGRVIQDNFLNGLKHLDDGIVDLIVTSPPYLNNYHYVRNTRPQLFWLGLIHRPAELKQLETANFGKYWQTVRDLETVPLNFRLAELERLLGEIRLINNERGPYGGHGWANYAASYFNDTYEFCRVSAQLLKPGGHAVVVVGNSILQGIEIPVDKILSDLASWHGLETEGIHIVRKKRVGDSIVSSSVRQGVKSRARLYESAVVLRRR
jgi:SAM-dependent methyltransferase